MVYEQLRQARIEAGLTQAEMGAKLGLTMAGYRQKETGERKISIDEAQKMAEILGKNMADIFLPVINQNDELKSIESVDVQTQDSA